MSISIQDYKTANEIFFKLLKKNEIQEKDHKELFLAYINNDDVREALQVVCEASQAKIIAIYDKLYLIPNEDNDILGFNYRKTTLLGNDLADSYLAYLIITIIFAEFTNEFSPASYIEVITLLELVNESLERAVTRPDSEEVDRENSINIVAIHRLWCDKNPWDESDKNGFRTTKGEFKIGFIRKVISFLKGQDLIIYITDEDKIKPTTRFTELMNHHFLDEDRKNLIESLLLEKREL